VIFNPLNAKGCHILAISADFNPICNSALKNDPFSPRFSGAFNDRELLWSSPNRFATVPADRICLWDPQCGREKKMKTVKLLVVGTILISMVGQSAEGQKFKFPFGKTKTETSQESLQLTQRAGPWLIMCASFSGEDGQQQAYRLAKELREKNRLDAYVYSHQFDFSEEVASKGLGWEVVDMGGDKRLRPKQMRPAGDAQFEEVAVLVGDFPSLDDSKAQRTLAQIKTLQPETIIQYDMEEAANGSTLAGARLRAWRDFATSRSHDPNDRSKGPLKAAFIMPNPLLPDEYFEARKVDYAVLNWNKDQPYSLLNNPGNYSVKIASFGGESTFELDEIEQAKAEDAWRKKTRKGRSDSKLVEAAKKATVLTAFLRNQNIEAYEFHDRHESYVCIGSFDWIAKTDRNGIKQNNPDVVETIMKYKGSMVSLPGRPAAMRSYPLPDKLVQAGIACDVQPLPVLVPKTPTQTAASIFGRK
jgi:hypothetical protein